MPKHSQRHLPISQRHYQTTKLVTQFSPDTWDRLRFRSLHDTSTPDGYIKRILNRCIELNALPPVGEFNRLYPLTKTHDPSHPSLASPYPIRYLQYLDNLIETLPPIYTSNGRSRRRMVETLTLIDLFN